MVSKKDHSAQPERLSRTANRQSTGSDTGLVVSIDVNGRRLNFSTSDFPCLGKLLARNGGNHLTPSELRNTKDDADDPLRW